MDLIPFVYEAAKKTPRGKPSRGSILQQPSFQHLRGSAPVSLSYLFGNNDPSASLILLSSFNDDRLLGLEFPGGKSQPRQSHGEQHRRRAGVRNVLARAILAIKQGMLVGCFGA